MKSTRRDVLAGTLALAAGHAAATSPLRIVFIGNSFTLQHDIPGLAAHLIRQTGQVVETRMIARNGAYLADHASDRSSRINLVDEHDPDIVILQEHSTAALTERKRQRSARAILDYRLSSRPIILFAPWPRQSGHALYRSKGMPRSPSQMVELTEQHLYSAGHFDKSIASPGVVARVGRAWLLGQGLGLYASDGYHASVQGAWLAALVLARTMGLAPEQPRGQPGQSHPMRLTRIAQAIVP